MFYLLIAQERLNIQISKFTKLEWHRTILQEGLGERRRLRRREPGGPRLHQAKDGALPHPERWRILQLRKGPVQRRRRLKKRWIPPAFAASCDNGGVEGGSDVTYSWDINGPYRAFI